MPGATHELGELRQPARRRGVVRHSAQGRANQPAGQGRKVRFFFFLRTRLLIVLLVVCLSCTATPKLKYYFSRL
jgi:hypothetical protein